MSTASLVMWRLHELPALMQVMLHVSRGFSRMLLPLSCSPPLNLQILTQPLSSHAHVHVHVHLQVPMILLQKICSSICSSV